MSSRWLEGSARSQKHACLEMGPQLCELGDGALGFWKAHHAKSTSGAREQARCEVQQDGLHRLEQAAQGSAKALKAKGRLHRQLDGFDARQADARAPSTSSWKPTGRSTTRPRLPGQGTVDRPADVLRLPRRALEASTHDQPHGDTFATVSSAHLPDQGLPVAQDGDGHGLQTMPVRSEKMEKTRWIEPSQAEIIRGVKFVDGEPRIAPPHDQPIHNF